jgi:hypothetical protein
MIAIAIIGAIFGICFALTVMLFLGATWMDKLAEPPDDCYDIGEIKDDE